MTNSIHILSYDSEWPQLFRALGRRLRAGLGGVALRAHPDDAAEYAALKQHLAVQYRDDREAYTDSKGPFIWEVMRRADKWARAVGWEPGPSDG